MNNEEIDNAAQETFLDRCPGCGEELQVPSEYIGQKIQCPYCDLKYIVPAPSDELEQTPDSESQGMHTQSDEKVETDEASEQPEEDHPQEYDPEVKLNLGHEQEEPSESQPEPAKVEEQKEPEPEEAKEHKEPEPEEAEKQKKPEPEEAKEHKEPEPEKVEEQKEPESEEAEKQKEPEPEEAEKDELAKAKVDQDSKALSKPLKKATPRRTPSQTYGDDVTPESLMSHFLATSLKKVLVFTVLVHVVVLVGTSVPYLWKQMFGGTAELSPEERMDMAVKDATSQIRKIAEEYDLKPQDITDRFSGGGEGDKRPRDSGQQAEPAAGNTGAEAGTASETSPEREKSEYEKQLEVAEEGPDMPLLGNDEDDVF